MHVGLLCKAVSGKKKTRVVLKAFRDTLPSESVDSTARQEDTSRAIINQ